MLSSLVIFAHSTSFALTRCMYDFRPSDVHSSTWSRFDSVLHSVPSKFYCDPYFEYLRRLGLANAFGANMDMFLRNKQTNLPVSPNPCRRIATCTVQNANRKMSAGEVLRVEAIQQQQG